MTLAVKKTPSKSSKSHQKWVVQTILWLVYECFIHIFLVGGVEHVLFVHILGMCRMSSSQLTNSIIFQRGGEKPPTSISSYGYGSIPINSIFRGMNIHLQAILGFTRGTRFWHTAI